MWQGVAVGGIVLVALAYAVWYWMPASARRALGQRMRQWGGAAANADGAGNRSPSRRSRLAAMLETKPGCTSCESCGGCGSPGSPPPEVPEATVGAHPVLWARTAQARE